MRTLGLDLPGLKAESSRVSAIAMYGVLLVSLLTFVYFVGGLVFATVSAVLRLRLNIIELCTILAAGSASGSRRQRLVRADFIAAASDRADNFCNTHLSYYIKLWSNYFITTEH